jgi:hypothetical protein
MLVRGMRRLRTKHVHAIYWIATLLFVMPQGWAAVQYLIEAPRMTATIAQLGYPEYFMAILGVAKLLGIAAIATGISPTLKEWAYAGFAFDTLGASASHLGAGDPFYIALVPIGFLAVQMVSYFAWKRLRAASRAQRRGGYVWRTRGMAASAA